MPVNAQHVRTSLVTKSKSNKIIGHVTKVMVDNGDDKNGDLWYGKNWLGVDNSPSYFTLGELS
jgi:hypothetical protein